MTKPIAEHYQLAQQKIQDGFWRVDTELGLIYGAKGAPFTRINSWGYIQIKFRRPDNYRLDVAVLAHRVIWEYANGMLSPDLQINHINGVKLDNRLINLESVTGSQNMRHAVDTGLKPGGPPASTILTEGQVREIYRRCAAGERDTPIALDYGVKRETVSNIRHGWSWAHITGHIPRKSASNGVGQQPVAG